MSNQSNEVNAAEEHGFFFKEITENQEALKQQGSVNAEPYHDL